MREYISKNKGKVVWGGFIFIFVIPFFIYLLFKVPAPHPFLDTYGIWTAGDILGFYGVVLGTTIAALGVYFTIQKTQENALNDTKNRVLPFIALSVMEEHHKYPTVKECEGLSYDVPEKNEYSKSLLKELFVVVDNTIPHYQPTLSKQQKYYVETGGIIWDNNKRVNIELVSFSCEIENSGTGLANDLRIGFNKKSNCGQLIDEDTFLYTYPIPLKVGQKINILIYAVNQDGSNSGEYSLDFVYSDIYGNGYRQRYAVEILKMNKETSDNIKGNIKLSNVQEKFDIGEPL